MEREIRGHNRGRESRGKVEKGGKMEKWKKKRGREWEVGREVKRRKKGVGEEMLERVGENRKKRNTGRERMGVGERE